MADKKEKTTEEIKEEPKKITTKKTKITKTIKVKLFSLISETRKGDKIWLKCLQINVSQS